VEELEHIRQDLGEGAMINTRYSGTEPLFRVMIQSESGHSMQDIARLAIRLCQSIQSFTGDANAHIDVKDCTTGASIEF
jgi:phosphomannomutase